ncbi:DinB family protein [Paenibacillus thalictri]|uniref:DUF1572 domain-containing protein n=1 Tax=Paenibacillus thalictri TaxID=2527873 RepID=A0A4Q9DW45_9BACL|nr:DinB family protein [Paenibacillus thalictri]TBL81284.1 DUF1572 domain-containing protein [Paenibacillus thalictri]
MSFLIRETLHTVNTELNRIEICLNRLSEEQVWAKSRPDMNSVGSLCVHLAGNEYQNMVSGIGGRPFVRKRTEEFTANRSHSKAELLALLKSVRHETELILTSLSEADLTKEVTIHYGSEDWNAMKNRGTGDAKPYYTRQVGALLLQLCNHYGYHTGQIVILTKLLQAGEEHVTEYKH